MYKYSIIVCVVLLFASHLGNMQNSSLKTDKNSANILKWIHTAVRSYMPSIIFELPNGVCIERESFRMFCKLNKNYINQNDLFDMGINQIAFQPYPTVPLIFSLFWMPGHCIWIKRWMERNRLHLPKTELGNMKLGENHMDRSDWRQFIRTLLAKYITRTHREICL